MQEIKLSYGKSFIEFTPPAHIAWEMLTKDTTTPGNTVSQSESEVIQKGVHSLIGQLRSFANEKSRLLVIVPDHTRRCGLERILPAVLPSLPGRNIEILIANGSHVLQPQEKITELVGEWTIEHYPVFQHDSQDQAALHYIGETSYGTPVWLNRKVREANFIITIGGILYHYFAGFGGGPKMLLPGVAGYETIRINHRRTIDEKTGRFHAHCHEGNIDTNPVYLDLAQIVKFVPNCLSLQVALNPDGRIIEAAAGPIMEVQRTICERVKDVYSLPIRQQADVVVAGAGGFPTDANLIQSHKSIHHAFQAVRKNGVMIVLARCAEGIGSKTFMPYFDLGDSCKIGRALLSDYQINGHTALTLRSKTEQSRIFFVSELDAESVRKTGMIPASTLAEAWRMAQPFLNEKSFGYIMPSAQLFVPMVHKS